MIIKEDLMKIDEQPTTTHKTAREVRSLLTALTQKFYLAKTSFDLNTLGEIACMIEKNDKAMCPRRIEKRAFGECTLIGFTPIQDYISSNSVSTNTRSEKNVNTIP